MAKIKQNVMGAFQGKVGTLTTYSAAAGNIARIRTNATNVGESASRTTKQQTNRVRWANMVNFYKASKQWMKKAFESKKKGLSDYNRFMSVNFPFAKVALTKSEAAAGACIVENFLISQGSLSPVQVLRHGDHWDTNINLGNYSITADTTVAALSIAILANNNFIREGMQLSFISYQQNVDDLGTPRVICTAYEMLIDTKNTLDLARSFLPEFCLSSDNGVLCTSSNISVGGFAYVLSETRGGRTNVSTQSLVLVNDTLLAQYTSAEQTQLAIDSYGTSLDVFLDSNEADEKDATPQPLYVNYIKAYDGRIYGSKMPVGKLSNFLDSTRTGTSSIVMSSKVDRADISEVALILDGVLRAKTTTFVLVGNRELKITAPSSWTTEYDRYLYSVEVVVKGVTYSFDCQPGVSEID